MTSWDLFKIYVIIIAAIISANYINALIFVLFRANKYEKTLAEEIAKEIKNG